jgi:hypothetical protein
MMMGQLSSGQERLFYSFNLEDHIPAKHLLRSIDQCLYLSDLRHYLADFYSPIGRPSIDPELMTRRPCFVAQRQPSSLRSDGALVRFYTRWANSRQTVIVL